jgi:hypothetical protein
MKEKRFFGDRIVPSSAFGFSQRRGGAKKKADLYAPAFDKEKRGDRFSFEHARRVSETGTR